MFSKLLKSMNQLVIVYFIISIIQLTTSYAASQDVMTHIQTNPLKFAVDVDFDMTIDQAQCFLNFGYQVVIIRVTNTSGAIDTNALSNINNAINAGAAVELYMYIDPSSNVSVVKQFDNVYNSLKSTGFMMKRIWVVVDYFEPRWYTDFNSNIATIQAVLDRIYSYGVQRGILTIYTDWNDITGGWNLTSDILLWYIPYTGQSTLEASTDFADYRPIASLAKPSMKRYQWGEPLCGIAAVNRDIFDPSSFSTLPSTLPMALFSWGYHDSPSPKQLQCLKNNNFYAVIVQVCHMDPITLIPVLDDIASTTINYAQSANLSVEIYMEMSPLSNVSIVEQFQMVYDELTSQDIVFKRIWVMVANSKYFGFDKNQNIRDIQAFVNTAALNNIQVGFFTSSYTWQLITGSYAGFGLAPLWYSPNPLNVNSSPNFYDFRPFGGWLSPTMKEFSTMNTICGLPYMDRVVFDPSLNMGQVTTLLKRD